MSTVHVLDPLLPEEIARAASIVRAAHDLGPEVRFVSVSTGEPAKHGAAAPVRAAQLVLHDPARRTTVEARVDLEAGTVQSWRELTGVEPQMTIEEFMSVEAAVRTHPQFLEALRVRDIDVDLVDVDPVSAGFHDRPEEQGDRRLARILAYVRPTPGGNAYARPIEGVFALVDVHTGELVHFEDRGPVPLPAEEGEFRADHLGPLRDDVREIRITQPDGPSFTVDGHEIRWQRWRLRVGFSTREGLVLHHVGYEDGGRVRPILHRASYAEMVVPYADPNRFYQAPLDIGEFNIGTMTNALTLGCDCLGEIRYFDGAYAAPDGTPVVVPNAICLHEEDAGMLWKHTDFRTGNVEVRRARVLVISSIVTVGNYEYGFYWYLHQDGTISSEVKATGIVATQAIPDGVTPEFGKLLAPNLGGIHHQHVFCVRLDLDVDGERNEIHEVHSEAVPMGPENPSGNAWRTVRTQLTSELAAQRQIDPFSARGWLIVNPERRNHVGEPVAYRLVPGDNTVPFSSPDSFVRRRAAFMDHHLWVTPFADDERYPAGEYPYQHRGGDGLPAWTAADRSLEDTDLVVWYTMIHHHVPRPEDWPVMPVARIGFELKPWGFFDRNPTLDVPPSPPAADGGCCH